MNTQNNNLIAATVIGVVTIISVVIVSIMRPDDGIIITILFGAGGAMVTQFLTIKQVQSTVETKIDKVAVEAKAQATETRDCVNDMIPKLLEAFDQGKEAEKKSQSDKTIAQDV